MIPIGSNYPTILDDNQNLFEVHDSLRVVLANDYNPGDSFIIVSGDTSKFSPTGIITLTEQCSEPELRAISFYYNSTTSISFNELELLDGFIDVPKLKNITNVTQNVMSLHHNNLKDALIAIEHMAGKKGETSLRPLDPDATMEQRINYLRKIVLSPKAWFVADVTLGLAPLTVKFTDQSFRLGTDGTSIQITRIIDFGDDSEPTTIGDAGFVEYTYLNPGKYDVKLTVSNDFGTDEVILPELITARNPAPDYATIEFVQRSGQLVTPDLLSIRSPINSLIDLQVTSTGEDVLDPINNYTWYITDDLNHSNSYMARASFGVGGLYDLILRTDTEFGSYRITFVDGAFDIVENINLWLWTQDPDDSNIMSSIEFGLISETFKTKSVKTLTINRDDSFLDGVPNEDQQKREFLNNNGFASRGTDSSGQGGVGILYWASGREPSDSTADTEKIYISEYNGFFDTYVSESYISRPWNWIGLNSSQNLYFILGGTTSDPALFTSPTNQTKDTISLVDLTNSSSLLSDANYKNNANELKENEVTFEQDVNDPQYGLPEQGHMSVYRSAWSGETGYFLRNQGVGTFFRIQSFYKTDGNSADPFINIRKLPSMAGPARSEGKLVSLSQGIYFFSNSGTVTAYNTTSGVWGTGGPGVNSSAFRSLQDINIVGFEDSSNTLLATSDGDKTAYLSYDYSPNAFIKFNEIDTTFSGVTARPTGTQWQITIF